MIRSIHRISAKIIALWVTCVLLLNSCQGSARNPIETQPLSENYSQKNALPSYTLDKTSTLSTPFRTPTKKSTLKGSSTAEINSTKPSTPTSLPLIYYAQSGDTLTTVARRFDISFSEITSDQYLPSNGLLAYNQKLFLPAHLAKLVKPDYLIPDSEVVYSPSAIDFKIATFLRKSNGYLSSHREYLASTGWTHASDIIQRVALENSINPRVLLALLEYHCHCVSGEISPDVAEDALLGNEDFRQAGLYRQLSWASSQLAVGYYGWRSADLLEFSLKDGSIIHPAPNINAGSVALQYYFAFENDRAAWLNATDLETGLPALYEQMFGDPWQRAALVEPLIPSHLKQIPMQLPFEVERSWSYTSGPHPAWEKEGALAALDFAPATYNSGCLPTDAWVTAVADGQVVRSEFNYVIQDLDDPIEGKSDGIEQTGWAVLYMHIAKNGAVPAAVHLKAGDRIGQPSCEGGRSTGTHVHIARKYNGEWVLADGYLPFNLSGWQAHAGIKPYEGTLTQGNQTVIAHWFGSFETRIALPTPTLAAP